MSSQQADGGSPSKNPGGGDKTVQTNSFFESKVAEKPKSDKQQRRAAGKRTKTRTNRKEGRYISSRRQDRVTDLALDATLREAAIYQRERRLQQTQRSGQQRKLLLKRSDMRQKIRVRKTRSAICFVVDASWSMAADERMRATKSAVIALLRDAYQRRDRVGLVSFQRDYATLLLPLTSSVELAQKQLQVMPTGGKTPLSRGMLLGYEVLEKARRQDPEVLPLMVLLTDAQANVAMSDLQPQQEAYALADFISAQTMQCVVIDTEHPVFERGLARQLAEHLKGSYHRLEDIQEQGIAALVRSELRR